MTHAVIDGSTSNPSNKFDPRSIVLWGLAEPSPRTRHVAELCSIASDNSSFLLHLQGANTFPLRLLQVQYDIAADPNQHFSIDTAEPFRFLVSKVVLEIRDNWGSIDFTCLYGIQVHRSVASSHDQAFRFIAFLSRLFRICI